MNIERMLQSPAIVESMIRRRERALKLKQLKANRRPIIGKVHIASRPLPNMMKH